MSDDSPIVLSTTAFNDAALCLKRYQYRHIDKLVPRPKDVRPTMRRGTWIHRCLQLHDEGKPWIGELERMSEWARGQEVPGVDALFDNCRFLVEDYIGFWSGREHREGGPFRTIATEIQYEYEPTPGRKLTATLDRLVQDPKNRYWIWERKTTEDIPDADWRGIDPQTLIQVQVAKSCGYNVAGVYFDYVRTDTGPSVRVYKPKKGKAAAAGEKLGGRIYEDVLGKAITTRAFLAAVGEIEANWQPGPDYDKWQDYVGAMSVRLVQDEAWFVRYPVFRPDDMVLETMRDVAMTIRRIKDARERNHYARSVNVLTCRLFCPYGKLCMHEYRLGRPSMALRDELFTVETPELRSEGRSEDAAYSRP